MKIEILTTTQNNFVWWAIDDEGQTTQREIALNMEDLKTQLNRYIETQFETERVVESEEPPPEPEFPSIDEVDESTGKVTKIPLNRR